ncbi:hypothetical protein AGMMS49545_04850 [Betaproteobacteria bacterium]|nr:hypothetical protein AGMMS49545_04850 [Betaproteobacteria bacterium]GHU41120.1 hypothetical protein AGMMS50289_03750 [Betaproteobacteria bacterium]
MSKRFVLTAARPVLQDNAPAILQLEFADGLRLPLDLSDIINYFPSLARLKNPAVFATATLADSGRFLA